MFFLLIRSIDLDAIFIALHVEHYTIYFFFCLQVLLTRDSLLALAKSIYYFIIVAVKILIEALKVRLRYYNFYPVEELVYLI